jgi:23S rRNA (cytosine1962-C5)-methyltransferase
MENILIQPSEAYELIDTGNGLRLERFGVHTVVRPDPSVLWEPTSPGHPAWINPDMQFDDMLEARWRFRKAEFAEGWEVAVAGVKAQIKPTPFRHMGIFPEQEATWQWLTKRIKQHGGKTRVLNLFGYTGLSSIIAAKAGAQVTHVDAAKGTVFWASENARRSGLENQGIRWIVEDVLKFVQREVRRGAHYDIIVMDPPVFGRGSKGEIWRLEKDLRDLFDGVRALLGSKPTGVLLNFYATPVYPEAIARLMREVLSPVCGELELVSLCLVESESKKLLQTGYTVRS